MPYVVAETRGNDEAVQRKIRRGHMLTPCIEALFIANSKVFPGYREQ